MDEPDASCSLATHRQRLEKKKQTRVRVRVYLQQYLGPLVLDILSAQFMVIWFLLATEKSTMVL